MYQTVLDYVPDICLDDIDADVVLSIVRNGHAYILQVEWHEGHMFVHINTIRHIVSDKENRY